MTSRKTLRTGGDPRSLPDYIALREEISKLTHPARPDVDWLQVENMVLRLFEHNGVELQTAAWYTLARMHIAGITGMNEGLMLLNALTMHQWSVMWPLNTHARMEIITGLNQRLQNVFRTLALTHSDHLNLLYQSEKGLMRLIETLSRHELKQASRLDVLLQQVRQAIFRLENAPQSGRYEPEVVLPAQAITTTPAEKYPNPEPMVYVVAPESETEVAKTPGSDSGRSVRAFIVGACSAVLVCGLLLWGWNALNTSSSAEQQLAASLGPLPDTLSSSQLSLLQQSKSVTAKQSEELVVKTQQQLAWLMALPPGWPLQHGQALISQARTLWPNNPAVLQMQKEWLHHQQANTLPLTALDGWQQGMEQLRQLAGRLNALDEKKGKYITVSELKSQVFSITQAFSRTVPAEEQLRQLATQPANSAASAALRLQTEQHLKQLSASYAAVSQNSPE